MSCVLLRALSWALGLNAGVESLCNPAPDISISSGEIVGGVVGVGGGWVINNCRINTLITL